MEIMMTKNTLIPSHESHYESLHDANPRLDYSLMHFINVWTFIIMNEFSIIILLIMENWQFSYEYAQFLYEFPSMIYLSPFTQWSTSQS